MAKITVAFADKGYAETIAGILSENGYDVFRICTSISEVMRAFGICEDGILVCGFRLKDGTAEQAAEDLGEMTEILMLARHDQCEYPENKRIFRLTLPIRKEVLLSSVDLLSQLHYQKLPHRGRKENETVRKAKKYLMEYRGMTEKEAHQFIQKTSMNRGLRMEQVALQILGGTEK